MGVKFTLSLTNTQKQIWFDCKLNPNSTMYLSSYKFTLEGDLDVNVIRKSWYKLVERHDALRTYFLESEGVPQQVILNKVDYNDLVEFYDFSKFDLSEALKNVAETESNIENFNLSKWPLHKINLFKVGTNIFKFNIYIHHILIDYSSFNLLLDELGKIYNSKILGNPLHLPEIEVSIKDYVEQEQSYIDKFKKSSIEYWTRTLENFTPILHLATSKTQRDSNFATRKYFTINSEIYKQFKSIAYQRKTTTFNVLAACYIILLHRFTNQEDITIGYPSGRRIPGFNSLVGFFINNLPLRVNLSSHASFYDILDMVSNHFTRPSYYDYYPLNEIAKIVRQNQNAKNTELFNTIFSSANFATQGIKLKNIKVTSELTKIKETAKDFLFLFDDQTDDIRCAIEYNVSLFQEELINSFVDSFLQLIQSIIDYPNTPISQLNILSKESLSLLYNEWSKGVKKEWDESNITKLIEKQAQNTPKNIAVVARDKALTYQELNERANKVAHYIDNVSWRILIDDFEKAYKQVVNNLAIDLPSKTHSYNHWAHLLSDYANSDKIKTETEFWNNIIRDKTYDIKPLNLESSYTLSDSIVVKAKLTIEETKLLLHKTSEAYRTQINDILLTALLMAYGDLTGEYKIYFNLEGHGREHIEKNSFYRSCFYESFLITLLTSVPYYMTIEYQILS